jgi:hypothetical protein
MSEAKKPPQVAGIREASEICRILGLGDKLVRSLRIRMSVEHPIMVTAQFLVSDQEAEELGRYLLAFKLEPAPESDAR